MSVNATAVFSDFDIPDFGVAGEVITISVNRYTGAVVIRFNDSVNAVNVLDSIISAFIHRDVVFSDLLEESNYCSPRRSGFRSR